MKGKFLEVLAMKDAEVGAFVGQYSLTSVVDKVRTERKRFQEGKRKGVVSCLALNCRLEQFLMT